MRALIQQIFAESAEAKQAVANDKRAIASIEKIIKATLFCYKNGGKILLCGNGGSAADAQHFASELVGRFKKERKALAAIALTTDSSILTAVSNDYSFMKIFARQVEALGKMGDILIGISTSGNSQNIIEAFKAAKKKKMKTIAILGAGGGKAKNCADLYFTAASKNTPRIQETHIAVIHIISEMVEMNL